MVERTTKSVTKEITFEKSGETLALTIELVNVSPQTKNIQDTLSVLYNEASEALFAPI